MSCGRRCSERAKGDKQWKERLASGVSYPAGDDVLEVAQQAYIDFFSVNALYPSIFPSTARFEREVIEMTAGLLHGDDAVGAISSGGTESNLLGVKSARDRATSPEAGCDRPGDRRARVGPPLVPEGGRLLRADARVDAADLRGTGGRTLLTTRP